ncbi:hypothetical protein SUGI_0498820 [Cryptomeria japonica]|uniref:outer envelope pore protein 16-2, chloroplastic isoform X1 n=1 Tax=Cryptomeria japonica TaxID=3369 RepID=UPI002408A591|nr:outer envelope pore protein 16-2, chloroplastic isoform X1 [Cryptomeria japonica]GLJ26004.1 hypothetical protein SUGI_0498820 [Cryptomeria japonica]
MNMNDMDGRSIIEEIKRFNGESFFDLGHPLLNGVAESFVKAAGIGAVQAVSREAYYTTIEGFNDEESGVEFGNKKRGRLPRRGESHGKSLEALVKTAGKESFQWGLGAGVYSGVTYGLKEARGGTHDWKNAAIAGALTGASVALTHDEPNNDSIVQSAITGAALSTVVSILNKMF